MANWYTRKFLLSVIESDTVELKTREEKIEFLFENFNSDYKDHIQKLGEEKALAGWLAGCPSVIDIPHYPHAILQLARNAGSLSTKSHKAAEEQILNGYYSYIARMLLQMKGGSYA